MELAQNNNIDTFFNTKFTINGTEWSVWDWTIFVIVIAVLIALGVVLFLFFCCISSTQEETDKEAMDAVEKEREELLKKDPEEENKLGEAENGEPPKEE